MSVYMPFEVSLLRNYIYIYIYIYLSVGVLAEELIIYVYIGPKA